MSNMDPNTNFRKTGEHFREEGTEESNKSLTMFYTWRPWNPQNNQTSKGEAGWPCSTYLRHSDTWKGIRRRSKRTKIGVDEDSESFLGLKNWRTPSVYQDGWKEDILRTKILEFRERIDNKDDVQFREA